MNSKPPSTPSLEPTDWEEFRQLSYRVVDRMIEHFSTLSSQPAWQPMPTEVRARFTSPLPQVGIGEEQALTEFFEHVLPYSNGNQHPRFWGYVQGSGLPLAGLVDFLASCMNAHLAGFDQAPKLVEFEVLRWLAELMGFPQDAGGILTSGGTLASIMALAIARRHAEEIGRTPERIYASTETHHWLLKGVQLLGLGRDSIHWIDADDDGRIRLDELRRALLEDRVQGIDPLAIIGNAGTVQTAAIDDLEQLATIARLYNVWLHIDGAFGALARCSRTLAPRLAGIEKADSLAFDLHKWMYMPFESACLLVRDARWQTHTFAVQADYLAAAERGLAAGGIPLADRGIELTRAFKALKVWICLKAFGIRPFAAAIEQNVEQAQKLGRFVEEHPNLELLAPVSLNVVCFRFVSPNVDDERLDALNQEILFQIQESGWGVPSATRWKGRFALRVVLVNHRAREEDLLELARRVVEMGCELTQVL